MSDTKDELTDKKIRALTRGEDEFRRNDFVQMCLDEILEFNDFCVKSELPEEMSFEAWNALWFSDVWHGFHDGEAEELSKSEVLEFFDDLKKHCVSCGEKLESEKKESRPVTSLRSVDKEQE